MTAGTIEVVPVSELEDLLGPDVPCHAGYTPQLKCPNPGVYRLSARCACGAAGTVFLCPADLVKAKAGRLYCNACYRADWTWVLR
jgi:hypothetical protein